LKKNDLTFVRPLVPIKGKTTEQRRFRSYTTTPKRTSKNHLINKPHNISFTRNSSNIGRGYCRNLAHELCRNNLVFSLDATNVVEPSYVSEEIELFNRSKAFAVFGRISNQ
jgi:hypothetical protein